MKMQTKIQTRAALAASLSILYTVGLTIVDELVPTVHTWLTQMFTHHWIGKSVLSVVIFLVGYLIVSLIPATKKDQMLVPGLLILSASSLLGFLVLAIFFGVRTFA